MFAFRPSNVGLFGVAFSGCAQNEEENKKFQCFTSNILILKADLQAESSNRIRSSSRIREECIGCLSHHLQEDFWELYLHVKDICASVAELAPLSLTTASLTTCWHLHTNAPNAPARRSPQAKRAPLAAPAPASAAGKPSPLIRPSPAPAAGKPSPLVRPSPPPKLEVRRANRAWYLRYTRTSKASSAKCIFFCTSDLHFI